MSLDWIRSRSMAQPHVTEHVQWECLVFKVGGKVFLMAPIEPERFCLSLKVPKEEFAELVERPGIAQAPYAAKGMWVALESLNAIPRTELEQMIQRSYSLVFKGLTKKLQAELSAPPKAKKATASKSKKKS